MQEAIEVNSSFKMSKKGQSDLIFKDQSVPKFLTENIIETIDTLC